MSLPALSIIFPIDVIVEVDPTVWALVDDMDDDRVVTSVLCTSQRTGKLSLQLRYDRTSCPRMFTLPATQCTSFPAGLAKENYK